jgi:arginyl-tRNA synthetase
MLINPEPMEYPLYQAKKEIIDILSKALDKLKITCEIKLEKPPEEMGDFAFPCFSLASQAKKAPIAIAEEIVSNLSKGGWIKKIESKSGYVNFYIDRKKLSVQTLGLIVKNKDSYGFLNNKKTRVIVEHTSANPNGPLHVGRARNPIIGDTIARLLKAAGFNVKSQFYLDDMGKQVAILTWGLENLSRDDVPDSEYYKLYKKEDHRLVGYYQRANTIMNEDKTIENKIQSLIKNSEIGDIPTLEKMERAYLPALEGIKESLRRINIEIDEFIPESMFVKDKSVDAVVDKLKQSEFAGDEDGAYYLDLESFGVKGRSTKFFFKRKDGTTLYATRDIAYHIWKAKNADMLVNILGEDHKLESIQVEIALKIMGVKNLPKVIFYSFVSLPEGKMSTRRGRVVYLDDLIKECVDRAAKEVKKRRGHELSENKIRKIAEIVGIGALRYNIIKVQPEKDIVFKWEEALNFEGNAAPFIQYSHARACSILSKKQDNFEKFDASLLTHPSELKLILNIAQFPMVVEDASEGFKPHIMSLFLFDLASSFNEFYRDCPVLPEENVEKRKTRLALVDATRVVIKKGLDILGIEAPEEM